VHIPFPNEVQSDKYGSHCSASFGTSFITALAHSLQRRGVRKVSAVEVDDTLQVGQVDLIFKSRQCDSETPALHGSRVVQASRVNTVEVWYGLL